MTECSIAPLMRNYLQTRYRLTSALLAISFAMLLGFQVVEASHLHISSVDYSECTHCQVETSAALSEPTRLQALAIVATGVATSYRSLALLAPYSVSTPRGPPALSS